MKRKENRNRNQITMWALVCLTLLFGVLASWQIAEAGSSQHNLQLASAPQAATFVAWIDSVNPPAEIITDDGTRSHLGADGGWIAGVGVQVATANLQAPPATTAGLTFNLIAGGLGSDAGTVWTYSAPHDGNAAVTNTGFAPGSPVGTMTAGACPQMRAPTFDGASRTIAWQGDGGEAHHIYRSQLPSGADNGASNGRYQFLATAPAGTSSYSDTSFTAGRDSWYVVVPAAADDAIDGCPSTEVGTAPLTFETGDVTCDEVLNVIDALFVLQYDVALRGASTTCAPPTDALYIPACDTNADATCNVIDALFILQCDVGISNVLCP